MPDPILNGQNGAQAPAVPDVAQAVSQTPDATGQQRGFFTEQLHQSQAGAAPSGSTPSGAPTAPSSPTSPTGIRAHLDSRGYNTSGFQSDEQLLEAIEASFPALQQLPMLRQHEQVAQKYYAHAPQFEKWLAEQQATEKAAAEAAAAKAGKPAWNRPEFDRKWMDLVNRDPESGRFVPNQYVDASVAQKVNDYFNWRSQTSDRLIDNFPDVAKEALAPQFESLKQEIIETIYAQQQQQQVDAQAYSNAEQYLQSRLQDFYEVNEQGQPVRQTQLGAALSWFIDSARSKLSEQYGIANPNPLHVQQEAIQAFHLWEAQNQIAQYQQTAPNPAAPLQFPNGAAGVDRQRDGNGRFTQAAPAPTPAERNQSLKEQFVGRGNRLPPGASPSREGMAANGNAELPTGKNTFYQLAKQEAARQGISI